MMNLVWNQWNLGCQQDIQIESQSERTEFEIQILKHFYKTQDFKAITQQFPKEATVEGGHVLSQCLGCLETEGQQE